MANSVEDALNRMSAEQREKAQATIEEARGKIQSAHMQPGDISSTSAASVTHNAQVIEDARRTIPFETMKDVSEVSSPPPPQPSHGHVNAAQAELSAETQANIESIQNTGGNNYLNQNAIDRAIDRQPQAIDPSEKQQEQETGR